MNRGDAIRAERLQLEQEVQDAREAWQAIAERNVPASRKNRAGKRLADANRALAQHRREHGN